MNIWTPSSMLANTTYNNATRPFIVYKQTGNVFIVNNGSSAGEQVVPQIKTLSFKSITVTHQRTFIVISFPLYVK